MRAFFVFCSGCAVFTGQDKGPLSDYSINSNDYVDHYEQLSIDFLKINKEISLSARDKRFLRSIHSKIVSHNPDLYKKKIEIKFHIIKESTPYYFSVPSGRVFISQGLLKKFVKSENILTSLLTAEFFRIHNNIYEKFHIIPIGFIGIKRILSILSLPPQTRLEILKWSYYSLKRSNFDTYSVLSWIQVQNKNSLEFSVQFNKAQNYIKEEYLFKNFLANVKLKKKESLEQTLVNSSKDFYKFQRSIR